MTPENNDSLQPLPPDTVVFDYQILELVGIGGWAYVYKAKSAKLNRLVALKQLKPDLTEDEKKLQRFLREAHIVAQIKHPNVVTIHDLLYEKETGLHFIVTELAEKGNLEDRLKEFPTGLPIDEVLDLAMGICKGLEAAHRKRVIHRDMKPSNVLLFDVGEEQDVPKVSDFGIAKVFPSKDIDTIKDTDISKSSGIHGSLPYMSPEQLDADVEVDHRSDLYSLGITLYELLTGRLPFTGDTQAIFWAHQFQIPTPLQELRPNISDSLEQVVSQALQKNRAERYQSAAGMHEAFSAVAKEERQRKFETFLKQGQEYLEEGKWEEAIKVLEQASSLEPENRQVLESLQEAHDQQKLKHLYVLAIECHEEGKWEKAREYLADVIDINPDYAGGQARERLEQATQELERERNKRDLRIQYRTGMGHFHNNQWTLAITELKQVVAQDPDFEDAADRLAEARRYARTDRLFEQAQLHMDREEWKEAVERLEEVELLNPPHIDDVTEKLNRARKKWLEARRERELADWYNEGKAQQEAGDFKQAKKNFDKVYDHRPDYLDVKTRRREMEEKVEEEHHLNQLLKRVHGHEDAGEWEQVISVCGEILANDPRNREASRCLKRAQKHIARREFNWSRCLVIATATVVPCTFLITQVVKDRTPLILSFSMGFLLLTVVPLSIFIERLISQRVKARSESQTNQ